MAESGSIVSPSDVPFRRSGSPEIHTPVGDAPIIPVIMIAVGFYLAWFGIHYWRSDTRWPTDPVKAVLQGKPLPSPSGKTSASQIAGQFTAAPGQGAGTSPPALGQGATGVGSPVPSTGTAGQNQAAAKMIATSMGHADWTTGQQWQDWLSLWNQESGWGVNNQNPTSTAYGIAQFLDATWATVGCVKTSDVATQIRCGIKYIEQRYGSPSAAWAHEVANNWY